MNTRLAAFWYILQDLMWTAWAVWIVGEGFRWWDPTIPDALIFLLLGVIILNPILEGKYPKIKKYLETKWYRQIHKPWKWVLIIFLLVSLLYRILNG